jgi:crotonobetainyl-CoA:carnitine CoA-transferase CaiB-like acyl-CoA transferase
MEETALEGIKVVDFSWAFAGPFIGAYLGDYGAQVVKVESHSRLDLTRVTAPYKDGITGINRSGCFLVVNNSKYGITLNLRHPRASEIIRKLIAWADIVVENFGAGVVERLGLGYDQLRKIKPDLIMLSATIQGQTGPRSTFAGYGWNTVALTGIGNLTGWPDRSPVGTLQAYPDSVVPWFGVVAVLAALDYRRGRAEEQYIDMSRYETTCQFLAPLLWITSPIIGLPCGLETDAPMLRHTGSIGVEAMTDGAPSVFLRRWNGKLFAEFWAHPPGQGTRGLLPSTEGSKTRRSLIGLWRSGRSTSHLKK